MEPDIPDLEAIPHGPQFKVWCKYCNRYHFHGREYGHRGAHCDREDDRPYRKTGYNLVPMKKNGGLNGHRP